MIDMCHAYITESSLPNCKRKEKKKREKKYSRFGAGVVVVASAKYKKKEPF